MLRFCRPDSISLARHVSLCLGCRTKKVNSVYQPRPSLVDGRQRAALHNRRSSHPQKLLCSPGLTSPVAVIPLPFKPPSPLYSLARDCSKGLGWLFKTCLKNPIHIRVGLTFFSVIEVLLISAPYFLSGGHHFRLSGETLSESLRPGLSRRGAK